MTPTLIRPECSAEEDVAVYFRLEQADRAAGPTRWRFRLPRMWATAIVPSTAGDQAAGDPADPLDVLIVDDQPETVEPLLRLLRKWGCRVDCVTSGAAALATLNTRRPRLILLDISMPQMDGLQVLATLRGGAGAHKTLPVAMLTADPLRADEARGLGAQDYILKPLDFTGLRERIDRLLNAAAGAGESAQKENRVSD
jgi:CheY-like chemotaxis protein